MSRASKRAPDVDGLSLVEASLVQDLSGRPHLSFDLDIPTGRIGTFDTQLVEHFFQSLANTSGMTLHIRRAPPCMAVIPRCLLPEHGVMRLETLPALSSNPHCWIMC